MKKLLFLIPFLASINLFARDLTIKDKIELFDDFSDGLNTQSDPSKLSKRSSPNLANCLIDEKIASLVKRNGYIVSGSTVTLTKIVTSFPFVKDNGDRELLVSDSSRTLSTRDFANYTVVKNTQTTSAVLRCAQGRLKAWCTNGVDPIFTWDGTTSVPLDGTNGTPNVPRGKFITFYIDRFWIAATTTSNSALMFSALSSTDGFALAPDDVRAWPGTNQLNISLGDSYSISGLDVFKGQLQVHKYNTSIYTVFGTDEFSFFARKTNAQIGTVSQDSIAQLDNLEYYLAKDGVYAFDGSDSLRISDAILPDIQAVISNLSNIVSNSWDTKSDFDAGGGANFYQTTTTVNGFVKLETATLTLNTISAAAPNSGTSGFSVISPGTNGNLSLDGVVVPTITVSTNFIGDYPTVTLWEKCVACGAKTRAIVKNLRTGKQWTASSIDTNSGAFIQVPYTNFCSTDAINGTWTRNDLMLSSFTVQVRIIAGAGVNPSVCPDAGVDDNTSQTFQFYPASGATWANVTLKSVATGQYLSNVSTVNAPTYWDTITSVNNSNGGLIQFYLKGATSPVNISTETWIPVSAGSLVTLPLAKRYVQWAATLSAVDISNPPTIDNFIINHNEGSANDARPFAFTWLNRYHLAVTTTIGGTSTLIYVKAKNSNPNPNAWVKFTGINIKSFARLGDNFQAGSSTAGSILRLDYGTNDGGSPISFLYETPDWNMDGRNFFEKNLLTYLVGANKTTGATLTVATSIDGGAFTNDTISLDGSGYLRSSLIPNNTLSYKGKVFRFRFSNSELDKPITINSFGVIYQTSDVY